MKECQELFRETDRDKGLQEINDKTTGQYIEVLKWYWGMINPGGEDDVEAYRGKDEVINDHCCLTFGHIVWGLLFGVSTGEEPHGFFLGGRFVEGWIRW